MRTNLLPQACAEEPLQELLRAGGSARYRYSLLNEEPITLELSAEVCRLVPTPASATVPQKNSSISR